MSAVERALGTAAYLSDIRIWAPEMKVAARRWLANFTQDDDKIFASALLDSFIYYSDDLVDELFVACFEALAAEVIDGAQTYERQKDDWQRFRDLILITHPTGEMPNVTDSGYTFDRRARQLLGIDQSHILEPEGVTEALLRQPKRTVVFVDDFAGSGDQFVKTWQRAYTTALGTTSFVDLAAKGISEFFYCPLVSTETGREYIESRCLGLKMRPTHILPREYSAIDPSSLLWPDALRPGARDFIDRVSAIAGVPAGARYGYADLALAVAFEHGVPDATLPILHWEGSGWTPLVKRR